MLDSNMCGVEHNHFTEHLCALQHAVVERK